MVLGTSEYYRTIHPRLGDVVTWELGWKAGLWSGLAPGWSMTATVRAAQLPTRTRRGATEAEDTVEQPCLGSRRGMQFFFDSPLPIPESVVVMGAFRVAVATPLPDQPMRGPWHEVDPDTLTTATVRRLRVVSTALAMRPSSYPGWFRNERVPGTEWFYDLTEPPEELHSYELAENELGHTRRDEVLLVDLEI